jgi:Cu2+-exporting ATPase
MRDGSIQEVPLTELQVGDRVLVRPGEKIPADGVILEGHTTVNEAPLTGESAPVEKKVGDTVIGGAINGEGSLIIEVQKTVAESYLLQVIELVRQAQETKPRTQDLANRVTLASETHLAASPPQAFVERPRRYRGFIAGNSPKFSS